MTLLLIATLIPVGLLLLFGFILLKVTSRDNLHNYPRKRK